MAKTKKDQAVVGPILALKPDDLDKRTAAYRHFDAVRTTIVNDLGGMENLSEVQKQLVDRFCAIALWCAAQDACALSGQNFDADLYGRVAGHMRRLAETIGLSRKARDITPLRERLRSGE